jgi:type II secretory pathway pseudopilin PulG
MNSVKCAACGFVGWGGVELCKKCGAALAPSSTSSPNQTQPFAYNQPGGERPNTQLKKGLAICALVIGILNLFTLGVLGLGAILGITLSIVALSKIKNNPSVYGGKEFATAGLVTSILSVMLIVPIGIIAAIAIPNLLASRRAANEGSTIQALRRIAVAEATYQSIHETYGTLDQLGAEGLIDSDLAAGTRHGYRFKIDLSNSRSEQPQAFEAVGTPVAYPSTGRRSFYVDERSIIIALDAHGADATRYDPPLDVGDD